MPKVWRLDCDLNGVDSIQSYIDDGRIDNISCPNFDTFDRAAAELQDNAAPGDAVIIDTISSLLETTRGDMMLGNDPRTPLWDKHVKFFGDKNYMSTYKAAQNLTLRRVKNLTNRNIHVVVVAHESEGKDPMASLSMSIPMVNPAMVDDLIGACSDVVRLNVPTSDVLDEKGRVRIKQGQRVLYLRRTDEYTAKFQVDPARRDPDKVPSGLVQPTFAKMVETLGKVPRCVCIYAYPGSGKTTLAAGICEVLGVTSTPQPATASTKGSN